MDLDYFYNVRNNVYLIINRHFLITLFAWRSCAASNWSLYLIAVALTVVSNTHSCPNVLHTLNLTPWQAHLGKTKIEEKHLAPGLSAPTPRTVNDHNLTLRHGCQMKVLEPGSFENNRFETIIFTKITGFAD